MTTFFLTCALLGGGVLVLQLLLGLVGLEHGHDLPGHGDDPTSDGLDLRSVRALSAGLAFFGLGALAGLQLGLGTLLAPALGALAGGAAMVGVASLMRSFTRLERDATLSLDRAIGQRGTVYLSIPAARAGAGKVHVTVQDRLVECAAVTPESALPTGAAVLVVDVEASDTLVVVRHPPLLEESHAS